MAVLETVVMCRAALRVVSLRLFPARDLVLVMGGILIVVVQTGMPIIPNLARVLIMLTLIGDLTIRNLVAVDGPILHVLRGLAMHPGIHH